MSIGPTSIPVGAAGSPLAQTAGPEADRVEHLLSLQRRRVYHGRKAEAAEGVSEADGEDHESAERDADGRPSCEAPPPREREAPSHATRQTKDHRGESGNLLDLTG